MQQWLHLCCAETQNESSERDHSPEIPHVYHSLIEVLSKKKATCLLPHCPRDCALELLAGAIPSRSRIYPFSPSESHTMERYMNEDI